MPASSVPGRAAEEGPVGANPEPQARRHGQHALGRHPVGGEVVLAAEPVVVDPGRVRDRRVDLSYPGGPAGPFGLIEVPGLIEVKVRFITFAGLPIIGHHRPPATKRRRAYSPFVLGSILSRPGGQWCGQGFNRSVRTARNRSPATSAGGDGGGDAGAAIPTTGT